MVVGHARGWTLAALALLGASSCKLEPSVGKTSPNVLGVAGAFAPGAAGAAGMATVGAAGADPGPGVTMPEPSGAAGTGVVPPPGVAGMGGAAGAAGEAAAPVAGTGAAGAPGAVDPTTGLTAEQCIATLMSVGTPITACEMCICQPGACQAELEQLAEDTAAEAMLQCVEANNCDAQCCLCNAPCDPLGSNYGMGPCAAQIEAAAGVTPGAGVLTNGITVQTNCSPTGPAGNSCANVSRFAACIAEKCAAVCSTPATCM